MSVPTYLNVFRGLSFSSNDNITTYIPLYASSTSSGTSESLATRFQLRNSVTYSHLHAIVTANTHTTATCTFKSRKNSAAGNQTISYIAGSTGDFEDTSNSDSCVSGNTFTVQWACPSNAGTTSSSAHDLSCLSSETGHTQQYVIIGSYWSSTLESVFAMHVQRPDDNANATGYDPIQALAATYSKMQCYINASTKDGTSVLHFMVNGATGSQSISVTSAATGYFEDTSNSDSVAAGDYWGMSWDTSASTTGTLGGYGLSVLNNTHRSLEGDYFGNISAAYLPIAALQNGGTATESDISHRALSASLEPFFGLSCYCSVNTRTATCALAFRINGSDAISVSIANATTGRFAETSTTASVSASTDTLSLGASLNGTGNLRFNTTRILQGVPPISGSGALQIPASVLAGVGNMPMQGTGALVVPKLTMAGAGVQPFSATGALNVPMLTMAGVGTEQEVAFGAGALTLFMVQLAAAATHTDIQGTGALRTAILRLAGSARSATLASGAIDLAPPTIAGSGALSPSGVGVLTLDVLSVNGAGVPSQVGQASFALFALDLAGTGSHTDIQGSGPLTLDLFTVSGTGKSAYVGTGGLALFAPLLEGAGLHTDIQGVGNLSLPLMLLSGSGLSLYYPALGEISILGVPSYRGTLVVPDYEAALKVVQYSAARRLSR